MKTLFNAIVLLLCVTFGFAQTGSTTTAGTIACISSFPYLNDFERGIEWSQSGGDDFDWSRDSGGTPSTNTTTPNHHAHFTYNDSFPPSGTVTTAGPIYFPDSTPPIAAPESQTGTSVTTTHTSTVTVVDSTAPTSGSSHTGFVFPEDSFPPKKSAILTSPCFDLSRYSQGQFSFAYSVQGSNSNLNLEMSTDGRNWTILWSQHGGIRHISGNATVVLTSGRNITNLHLRFVGNIGLNSSGSAWEGDMMIDDLSLTASGTEGRRVFQEPGQSFGIKAFPNPFDQQFSVTIPYVENKTATVALFNLRGQQVYRQSQIQSGGNLSIESDLAPGIYVVRVQVGEMQYQTKVTKSK